MPKWILPCEGDSISFIIPQDLYDKFKGVALCVVLGPDEGKVVNASCLAKVCADGQSAGEFKRIFYSIESDHVWFSYIPLLLVNLRDNGIHYRVHLSAQKASIKKCGFRPICKQKEDVLRMVIPAPSDDGNKLKFSRSDSEEDSSIGTMEADDLFEIYAG
ncbi:hypothetical protein EUGRSUZ_E03089 [Eucalyptus grandis]|uniref:Uncharacterized protein n=2 Tax=Eucalyptus grandis TaxID=71139 RepID=A0ACC3KZ30_EUCGR|nr:hypothetical protein EUGRSUZ_E03089 [Eucalyptus grandis]